MTLFQFHVSSVAPARGSGEMFHRPSATGSASLVLSIDHTGDADIDIQHTETGHGLDG